VGRDDELSVLRGALDQSAAGHGRFVLVVGEAGIGKSRLLEELKREASPAHVVLTGRAVEGGGAYRPVADALVGALRAGVEVTPTSLGPYGPALARLLPDWTGVAGAASAESGVDPGLVLGEAVARFLGLIGHGRPCLLLLEDLHWADADSWAVLAHVAIVLPSLPVVVVATMREDEPAVPPPPALSRLPAVTTLRLGRFSQQDVHRLADTLGTSDPATLGMLDERADGLPFLVEELVALRWPGGAPPSDRPLARADLPPTLQAMVADRIATLTGDQQRVLGGAAVLGLTPDWSLLHRVTGVPEAGVLEALRAAHEARLLAADAGSLRWRHALTKDAVLALVLPPELVVLSLSAADVLLARGRPDDDVAAADILLRAGADDAVSDLLLTLARRDVARGAFRTAERHLDDLARTGYHRAAAAVERVRLLCLRGRSREALDVAGPVLDEATGHEHAELALTLARAAVLAGRWDTVGALVERAGRPDDSRSAALLADAAHGAGRLDEARGHAVAALARAEMGGNAEQLCDALVILAKVERLGEPKAARALFDRAAQVAAENGLVAARVESMLGQATLEMLETENPSRLAAPRELAEQAGLVGQMTAIDLLRADAVLVHDGPAAAVPLAHDLLECGRLLEMPMPRIAGLSMLALASAAAGDRKETHRLLTQFETAEGPREAAMIPAAVLAMLALASHDLRTANAVLDPAISPVVRHHSTAPLYHFGLWALLRTVTNDRGAEARLALAQVPVSRRRGNAAALGYAEAVAAGRAGRAHEASAALHTAEELAAATPWLRRLLRTVALDSAVVDGWGDPVPLLRASLAEHEQTGEEALARVVRDLLRRTGVPTRRGRGATSVPASLASLGVTSREADVLTLLIEGATNAEIAERLFLSRRTVETHVAHLLHKTSSANRAELRTHVTGLDC
jgi:DNA-binding CsgD family transcriptional regulator